MKAVDKLFVRALKGGFGVDVDETGVVDEREEQITKLSFGAFRVNAARRVLAGKGVRPIRFLTGSYVTSLDMAGCSVTVTLLDAETEQLWDAPVHTSALRW